MTHPSSQELSILSRSSAGAQEIILPRLLRMAQGEESGLLFHGTCEPISGPLRPGAYDGVFWTARNPAIAQAYIPSAGVKRILQIPSDHDLGERIRPTTPDDPVMTWALARCRSGWEDLEVEIRHGRPISWRILDGWPNRGDLRSWIAQDLGYGLPARGYWEVACARDATGVETFMPQVWRLPGQLFVLHVPDLEITQPIWSDDQVHLKPHNRTADFRRMAASGVEAFSMSDLLQSDHLGNVPHVSVGLLPAGLARADWISIPARRHDGEDPAIFGQQITPDLAAFLETATTTHPGPDDPSPEP